MEGFARERKRLGLPSDYDRNCINIVAGESEERASKGETHAVRLKLPDVPPAYTDLVYGAIGQRNGEGGARVLNPQHNHEDPIIIKSDGHPTYHLANVVDDHHMRVTHVIRAVVSRSNP